MGVGAAFVQGWQRVWRARVLLTGIFFLTGLLAAVVPVAGSAALGPASRTVGLGLAAGLELRLAAEHVPHAPLGSLILHLAASLVLLGALLAGLTPPRPPSIRDCVAAGVVRAFRFLRLGAFGGIGSLASAAVLIASPDVPGAFLALNVLFLVSLFVTYAEVRLVAEDRRSALGALVAGARFVRANAATTIGLHVLNSVVLGVAFLPFIALGPAAANVTGAPLASILALSPVVLVQMQWTASQMALFQARLGAPSA